MCGNIKRINMEQKRVSFKVAKVIKDAGYPQGETDEVYTTDGNLECFSCGGVPGLVYYDAPYVMEVWLWLCRERHSYLSPMYDSEIHKWYIDEFRWKREYFSDPEEAIKSAIEYLCDNDLIK